MIKKSAKGRYTARRSKTMIIMIKEKSRKIYKNRAKHWIMTEKVYKISIK
jgi:hypothetical protein